MHSGLCSVGSYKHAIEVEVAYLQNHTPNPETELAPMEVFTKTNSNHAALQLTACFLMPHLFAKPKVLMAPSANNLSGSHDQ